MIFWPAGNRGNFIHQVSVANFNYGVFVMAQVEEEEGSIIQNLIMIFYRLILTNINHKRMQLAVHFWVGSMHLK